MLILDELHTIAREGGSFGAVLSMGQMRKRSTRQAIATQAIMKFNSGKRVRYLCSARWEDTGESIKPAPKKFVPAQVVRRATA